MGKGSSINMEITESESMKEISESILVFTRDLCKIFRKSIKENYICSPLSAHIVLSMAAYGADKNTAVEMRKVLHIYYPDSKLREEYQKLMDLLNNDKAESQSKDHQCTAVLANKIYISNKDIIVLEEYDNALDTYFRSKSETLDFSKNEESAEIINNWCAETTNGKITDIVRPSINFRANAYDDTITNNGYSNKLIFFQFKDQFTDKTGLLLINAVYFKGAWSRAFFYTIPELFYLGIFKKIQVPTMMTTKSFGYRNLPELDAKAVRLDFEQSDKYMEIIIPNQINGLKTIVENLDKISRKNFEYVEICLWLPKFKVQSDIQFVDHLKKLGMIDAFKEGHANFNKICNKALFIETVLQKAYIKVDEWGCEAAAASAASLNVAKCLERSFKEPMIIKANRPFLFRIMDSKTNVLLFIGTVVNPISQ